MQYKRISEHSVQVGAGNPLSARKRFSILALIMLMASGMGITFILVMLYRHDIDDHLDRLQATVQSQSRLVEAVARYDARASEIMRNKNPDHDASEATLSQIIDAHNHYRGFGETGEITIARHEGDLILFILGNRHGEDDHPTYVEFDSDLATPMRLALEGLSGTIVGPNYRGEIVLAAYEPIAQLNLGIVAKIDLAEIRAPFIRIALLAITVALLFSLAGTTLFFWIGNPMIIRMEIYSLNLEKEIEERKRAEEELRQYERIVSSSTDMMALLDRSYIYLTVNDAYATAFNRVPHELIGYTVAEVFGEEFFETVIKPNADPCLAGEDINFSTWFEFPSKGQIYMDIKYSPYIDTVNEVKGFVVSGRDISERKRAEKIQQVLLNISQSAAVSDYLETFVDLVREHLGKIIDTTNFYIALYDEASGGYTFPIFFDEHDSWGGDVEFIPNSPTDNVRLTGKSRIWIEENFNKERVEKDIVLYGTPFKCWLGAPLQTKEGVIGVLAVQSYDNPNAYSEQHLQIVDNVVGTIAIAIQKKQTEEALAKSEQDLRNFYENTTEGIFCKNPDGKFLFANLAMATMLGYDSVDDLLNDNAEDQYVDAKRREEIKELYVRQDHIKNWESEMMRKDGSKLWVRISSAAVKDEHGTTKWYEGFVSDISESKKLEQEILKSQKLESVGLLAGGLAHDFNNALTTIQLQTATASLKKGVSATVMKSLKKIDQSVAKAKSITHQMLTFSKGDAPVRKTTDMGALIQELVQFALSGTNLYPTFEIDEDLHNSNVDHNQINQVVSNLVINARHVMLSGGDLKIVAKNISVTPTSKLGPLKQGEYISVSITDYGHGIEPANLDKIFDPYFTTKPQGSGLGLFSCYSIMDKHDGWITAESEIGEGSVFTFYLPRSTEDLPESATAIDNQEIIKGMGNILIMDDNDSLRGSLAELLEDLGYAISESADGEEAIRIYSEALEAGTPFNLVILDLTVPAGIGGRETIKRLLEIDPDVKSIVSSGYSDDSVIADHKAHGFSAILPKPYTLDVLAEVVNETIEQV